MEELNYKLDQFEGPLDLLLTLILKNKIDINDIPISELCDQYMKYIEMNQKFDIEVSSEFLVMASQLMLIKSKMLLPRKEDEEDPRLPLVQAVIEYERAKKAAEELLPMYSVYSLRMVKEEDEISVDRTYVADQSVEKLIDVFRKVLNETHLDEKAEKKKFDQLVNYPQVSIFELASDLYGKLKQEGKVYLDSYFRDTDSKPGLIAKFVTILDMLRQSFISISEDTATDEYGVTTLTDHISIKLSEDIDENEVMAFFDSEY